MKRFILMLAAVAFIAAGNGCGNANSKKAPATQKEERSQKDEHATLKVGGSCGMCKTDIEKAAKSVDGVSVAEWNRDTQQLHLHFDPAKTSVGAVSKVIAKTGHDTEKDKADDETYNALPECCKYRK